MGIGEWNGVLNAGMLVTGIVGIAVLRSQLADLREALRDVPTLLENHEVRLGTAEKEISKLRR